MEISIRERLFELADEEYRRFQSGLLPGVDCMIGVRLPQLRTLAKSIAKRDWRGFLLGAPADYFEEIMLQGMVIGYAQAQLQEMLQHIAAFIPKIDNWSVCDSFCSGLKIVQSHPQEVWDFLQPFLCAQEEFFVRFGVVMLLNYYITDDYITPMLALLDGIRHEGYYAKMAVAWALSICYVRYPEKTMQYLKSSTLDDFTYNKALQKMVESRCVDATAKALLSGMKRR